MNRLCHLVPLAAALVLLMTVAPLPADTLLDRIGPDSAATDGRPGRVASHTHPGLNPLDFWGTAAVSWTQPLSGTLTSATFVVFGRVQHSVTNLQLPLTNFSAWTFQLHLWTNGPGAFLTNARHGELVVALGAGPANPAAFGSTTNPLGDVLPTYRLTFPLVPGIPVSAGRGYALALVCERTNTAEVIRVLTSAAAAGPDLFAGVSAPAGPATAPLAVKLEGSFASVRIAIAPDGGDFRLTWPDVPHNGLWRSTNLRSWSVIPQSLGTNFLLVPNAGESVFFKLGN